MRNNWNRRVVTCKRERDMKAVWNNRVIAKSDNAIEIDGVFYFPLSSLNEKYFLKSTTRSRCPWKGLAFYLHIMVANEIIEDAGWFYNELSDCPEILRYRVAFWKGVEIRKNVGVSSKIPDLRTLFASIF